MKWPTQDHTASRYPNWDSNLQLSKSEVRHSPWCHAVFPRHISLVSKCPFPESRASCCPSLLVDSLEACLTFLSSLPWWLVLESVPAGGTDLPQRGQIPAWFQRIQTGVPTPGTSTFENEKQTNPASRLLPWVSGVDLLRSWLGGGQEISPPSRLLPLLSYRSGGYVRDAPCLVLKPEPWQLCTVIIIIIFFLRRLFISKCKSNTLIVVSPTALTSLPSPQQCRRSIAGGRSCRWRIGTGGKHKLTFPPRCSKAATSGAVCT